MTIVRGFLVGLLTLSLAACSQYGAEQDAGLIQFIEALKAQGVDGDLIVRGPINDDMVYVAEYAVAKYTSTRIISIFKCKTEEGCEKNLQQAVKNDKLSGQARNGTYLMAATFYPPEEEAVEKIKQIFLKHEFAQR